MKIKTLPLLFYITTTLSAEMGKFYKALYECDDASVSSNSETLSLDVADDEINIKEVKECNTQSAYSKIWNISENMQEKSVSNVSGKILE